MQNLSPGDSSNPCTPVLEGLAGHAQSFQVQQAPPCCLVCSWQSALQCPYQSQSLSTDAKRPAQVDSFNRASSGRGGKIGRLFSGRSRSSPKTPNTASPVKSDPPTAPTGPSLSLDDMLIYQPVSAFQSTDGKGIQAVLWAGQVGSEQCRSHHLFEKIVPVCRF